MQVDMNTVAKVGNSMNAVIERIDPRFLAEWIRHRDTAIRMGETEQAACAYAKKTILALYGEAAYTQESVPMITGGSWVDRFMSWYRITRSNLRAKLNERRFQNEQDHRRSHGPS